MATQQEMEATYNYMDEIFRLSPGETGDLTCAMYNGDFSKTLAQAQRDKHAYVLDALNIHTGFRMLDLPRTPLKRTSEKPQKAKLVSPPEHRPGPPRWRDPEATSSAYRSL